MKKLNANLAIIFLAIVGFMGCQQSGKKNNELITVDVSANYPEKELILQDFMDVEYIPLETTDEFITQGVVEAIGKNIVLVRNWRDGNIFVFDRTTGKGIKKINRFGQGPRNIQGFTLLYWMRIIMKCLSQTIPQEKYRCMIYPETIKEVSSMRIPAIMTISSIMIAII